MRRMCKNCKDFKLFGSHFCYKCHYEIDKMSKVKKVSIKKYIDQYCGNCKWCCKGFCFLFPSDFNSLIAYPLIYFNNKHMRCSDCRKI